ncbi:PREDICTED: uncharacterized protein LOC104592277 isoform X3 [Nelumbo nucifera]|uniref:Uncharacterized protein LOC104592277 isoform X3 n=1 Tax=Nelumbo nucifera TaxID=4432 RepID=A0A1U7Z8V2_NELNU|nr:PREDICTED: uncharacterized protein LOC104592277 isoform X3 [Nelumbo nucifera]
MTVKLSRPPAFSKIPSLNHCPSSSSRFPTSFSFNCWFSRRISCQKMSCSHEDTPQTLQTITISYSELKDKDLDLSTKIEDGFGPNGLGILSVSEVPGFPSLRQNLLHLSPRLASLPEEVKKELEDPQSRYNFGWSHGKEKLESAFKSLGKLIFDVGLMLAYHCDRYASKGMTRDDEGFEKILMCSRCHKGRLLYYFPAEQSDYAQDAGSISSWCGWHTDHGSLTGLTCGMFMRDGVEVPCPDSAAGLYVKTRTNQIVKVVFQEDEIAFQVGETTEILSGGRLCATPHCVQAPKGEQTYGVERSTFALFMQPDWDESLNFPKEVHLHQELIPPNGVLTFGEYSEKLLDKYYHSKS